ncbi:CofH family radical SAM protein [bacterium]|nr:MAG: CofH family radical SAM protein [bacterium]
MPVAARENLLVARLGFSRNGRKRGRSGRAGAAVAGSESRRVNLEEHVTAFLDPALRAIEAKLDEGIPLSLEDGLTLFKTPDLHGLGRLATNEKRKKSGQRVFYVHNRYMNTTNVCYAGCKFCSFAVGERSEHKVRMTKEQILAKAVETGVNFNQIHIVGGHDPKQLSLDFWVPLIQEFKQRLPHAQLSFFTAAEIEYMAQRHRLSREETVKTLAQAGLDNVNGGGAEVFSQRFREIVCPGKIDAAGWLEVHEHLHRHGVSSNATMLYGTIETLAERVEHLIALRESQQRSPGYNAFIPLAFHPDGNELDYCGWTTGVQDLRMFAVARLMLNNFDHIKAYWMIQGLKVCQLALHFGADDMDGTHGESDEERIYHSAGTQSGQYVDAKVFRTLIEEAGYEPVRRNSTYDEFPIGWEPPKEYAVDTKGRRIESEPAPQWWGNGTYPVGKALEAARAALAQKPRALRSGRISYTNDLPVYTAFDRGDVVYPGRLESAVPADLNRKLLAGELELSPVSSFFYAQHHEELVLLPDICIGARTQVLSVVLLSDVPPALLSGRAVHVTTESASGRALLELLLRRRYGVEPVFVEHGDPLSAFLNAEGPALVIGDRAIDAREQARASDVYDLGTLWNEWTGEEMVYAVWAASRAAVESRRNDVAACVDALRKSLAWGLTHKDDVIAAAERQKPRGPGFYQVYYDTLVFNFDERAQRGLARFYDELGAAGMLDAVPFVKPEDLRVTR